MKNTFGKIKKNRLILVLALSLALAVLISAGTTYAIFTNSNHAQRTIAPYGSAGDKFSSNYLSKTIGTNLRTVFVTDARLTPSTVVTICNYDQGNQVQPNENNITYSITAKLVYFSGSDYSDVDEAYLNDFTDYSINVKKGNGSQIIFGYGNNLTYTFSGNGMTGGIAQSDPYTISFSPNFASNQPNLYLQLTVTGGPVNLAGIFKTGVRAAGATNTWIGEFRDSTTSAPSDYDGFNYRISGSGSGTFTLTWDNTKVALSYESIREHGFSVSTSGNLSSITLSVDSDVLSVYDLQFYKVNITNEDWDDMTGSVVTYTFS